MFVMTMMSFTQMSMKAIAGGNDECRLQSYLSGLGSYAASSQL